MRAAAAIAGIVLGGAAAVAVAMAAKGVSAPAARAVPFDCARWKVRAAAFRVEEYLGRESLYLANGVAWVDGVRFADGALDFDLAMSGERGFMGAAWRVQDEKNFEYFYLRPHQSGNPDATQYTPVFHGILGWQLYHGEPYSAPLVLRFKTWVHLRVAFAGTRAEIYVGDMEKPVQVIDPCRRGMEPGSVGISVGELAPAHVANFSYTVRDTPAGSGSGGTAAVAPEVIGSWSVSEAFPEASLFGKTMLAAADVAGRRWTRLAAEGSGLANLARVQGVSAGDDTVLVRKILVAAGEQTRRLDFGFCNRVRVYLNGRLLYSGSDSYRSRDYRFLGSIGWFDALYLPLAAGRNELVLAVSEDRDLGGWGVQARLDDGAAVAFED